MPRKFLVAVDAPPPPESPLLALAQALVGEGDEVHVATVLPAPTAVIGLAPPLATAASATLLSSTYQEELAAAMKRSRATLDEARRAVASASRRAPADVAVHLLPSAGGASGSSTSLLAWAHSRHVDVVLVGCRGLGAAARAAAPLVGLGSVSAALATDAHAPAVAIARGKARPVGQGMLLVVGVDAVHGASRAALRWAASTLRGPGDALHVVAVAQTPPFPVFTDEGGSVTAVADAAAWDRCRAAAAAEAARAADAGAAFAATLVFPGSSITAFALTPDSGGAAAVADALGTYAAGVSATALVAGSRGISAWKRTLLAIVGLGSVSAALATRAPVPVVVVRDGGRGGGADHDAHGD